NTALLFADRASATSLKQGAPHTLLHEFVDFMDDGEEALSLIQVDQSINAQGETVRRHCLRMIGKKVFKKAVQGMVECVEDSAKAISLEPSNNWWIVPHQANGRIIQKMQKELNDKGWPTINVVNEIAKMGNVAGSGIFSALKKAWDRIPKGSLIFTPAMGAGPGIAKGFMTKGNVVFQKNA
ncbi:MAG: hypothetical protein RIQ56_314, partial [Candidatus Parcubacteria bacterium]